MSFYEWEGSETGERKRDGAAARSVSLCEFLVNGRVRAIREVLKCGGYIFMNGEDSEWHCACVLPRFL